VLLVVTVLFCNSLVVAAKAQQQQPPEDPEDEKQVGLWLDQGISADLSPDKSLEFEFHERFDEGASNLFEYFFQGGVAFRLRPWLTVIPIYRYQRFPANPTIAYENRLQLNVTLSTSRGPWRPNLRTLIEGRFPDNRPASARLRFRPGIDCAIPLRVKRPPVLVVQRILLRPRGEQLCRRWKLYAEPIPGGGSAAHRGFIFYPALLLIAVGEFACRLGHEPDYWDFACPQGVKKAASEIQPLEATLQRGAYPRPIRNPEYPSGTGRPVPNFKVLEAHSA